MTAKCTGVISNELLRSPPRLSYLDEIALHFNSWENLAPYFGISDEEKREIQKRYSGHYRIQKQKALRAWRRNLGEKATLESLMDILHKEKQVALAEKVEEIVGQRPTCLPIFAKYVREYYKFDPNVYAVGKQNLYRFDHAVTHAYVDLTLHEVLPDEMIGSATKYKVVTLCDVLNNGSEKIAILFEGVAGSGKTTMSLHICLEWAERRLLQQLQLLIHVQVSDPRVWSAKCLADLIPDAEEEMRDEVAAAIVDERGKGVCILLEGLDEAPDALWDSILSELIAGVSGNLSDLSFILTARPGCQQLKNLKNEVTKVLVKGFDRNSINQFIENSISDSTSKVLVKKLDDNPRLASLCSLPVNATTMTFLAQHFEKEIPETQTGISKLLLVNFLTRHIQTKMGDRKLVGIENFDKDLEAYPSVRKSLNKLCSLSYSGLLEKKKYFTAEDLSKADLTAEEDQLGLLQVQTRSTLLGHENFSCFPHLSFQEFLAAVHLSQMDQDQQTFEIKKIFNRSPLSPVLPLYAGLTHLINREVFQLLSRVMEHPLNDASTLESLELNLSHTGDPRRKALALFHCLYECQNDELMTSKDVQLKPSMYQSSFFGDKLYQISMNELSMTPADCLALGYFVRNATLNLREKLLVHVHLGRCSDAGISAFIREAKGGSDYLNKHAGLVLFMTDYVPQDESSPLALKYFLQGQSNVAILQLIFGSGMSSAITRLLLKCITEGITANSSCRSMTLIFTNGLSKSYIHDVIQIFSPLNRLSHLSLSYIDLKNGAHLLAEALQVSNIQNLSLNDCNIDDSGLASLGKGISRNNVLKILDVKSNPYTVHGAIQFLKCLITIETALCELKLNDKVFVMLPLEEEYQGVILHITALRVVYQMNILSINPINDMLAKEQEAIYVFAEQSDRVRKLPPQINRAASVEYS